MVSKQFKEAYIRLMRQAREQHPNKNLKQRKDIVKSQMYRMRIW